MLVKKMGSDQESIDFLKNEEQEERESEIGINRHSPLDPLQKCQKKK